MSTTKLRIGMVSPPYIRVQPKMSGYAGTERVVSALTEELVQSGHDVVLFAPDGSSTKAKHVSTGMALWLNNYTLTKQQEEQGLARTLETAYDYRKNLDILHFHIDEGLTEPMFANMPTVTTLHDGKPTIEKIKQLGAVYNRPIVFISKSQRKMIEGTKSERVASVVYNGIDLTEFRQSYLPGNYLVFLGRVSDEKGMHIALDASNRAKMPIVAMYRKPLTNPDDSNAVADWKYYHEKIIPRFYIYGEQVKCIIDPSREVRNDYLRNSLAILVPSGVPPSSWSEPFGLVVTEAMAHGTPAIVYNRGGPAEIVLDGKTGYIAKAVNPDQNDSETIQNNVIQEMAHAVDNVKQAGMRMRLASRLRVEYQFSSEKMAENYVAVYKNIIKGVLRTG